MRLVRIAACVLAASVGLVALPASAATAAPASAAAATRGTTCSTTLRAYPDLTQGSRGPAVAAFQCLLRQRGAKVTVDGVYGPRTRAAYLDVARRYGWQAWVPRVEGHVWTLLLSQGSTPVLRRGSRGEPVARLQRALRAQGYRLAVDGVYGRQTERTVRELQTAVGRRATGIVGTDLWSALQHGGFPTD